MLDNYTAIKALIEEGQAVRVYPDGISMRPFITKGRTSVIIEKMTRSPKKGDILLYTYQGVPVVHRVHRILSDRRLVMLGDGNTEIEPPMDISNVVGVVTSIETDGKATDVNSCGYRIASTIWNNILPLRKIMHKMKNRRFIYKNYLPKDHHDMLSLIRYSLLGEQLNNQFDPNFNTLLPLIYANKFETLLGDTLLKNKDKFALTEDQFGFLQGYVFNQQVEQYNTFSILDEIFEYAKNNDIKIAALKGINLAGCYPVPESRHSDDADIYAPGENFDKMSAYLESTGFKKVLEEHQGQIGTAVFTLGDVCVELHRDIAVNTSVNRRKAIEKTGLFDPDGFVWVDIAGHMICTINPTNQLIYLIYHCAKHFINSNCEGRMLTDITLFVNSNLADIDFDKFHNTMYECGLDKFCDAVFNICCFFFDMDKSAKNKTDRNVFSQRSMQKLLYTFFNSVITTDMKQMQKLSAVFVKKSFRYKKKKHSLRTKLALLSQSKLILRQKMLSKKWKIY